MATDTKSPPEKLSVTSKTTLTLKPRAETGVVRQSFSHGRSKAVVVEKVRKRTLPGEAKPAEAAPAAPVSTPRRVGVVARGATPAPAPAPTTAAPAPAQKPSGVVLRTLTEEEQSRRAHALGDAKV